MKVIKIVKSVFCFIILGSLVQCASGFASSLEDARFQLDQGNYTAAIASADSALASNPGNIEATRIKASALFGRSGFDFLDIASGLLDLGDSTDSNFSQIASLFPDPDTTTVSLTDLRDAILALETLANIPTDETAIANEDLADAVFDLATMQMIEHFALGVYGSDFLTAADNTTVDVTGIVTADATQAQEDLLAFDNRMIASGVDSTESFVAEVRQAYCILDNISDSDADTNTMGDGFTLAEFQDLVGCQLSTNNLLFTTTTVGTCADLDPATQIQAVLDCYDVDTSL